jgi:hypothetical protein
VPKPTGPLQPPDLPLSFREEIVPRVFSVLTEGSSVALVGLAGVGVSNVMRFLAEPRVSAHFLGPAAAETLVAYLEADRWPASHALYTALAQATVAAAHARDWPRAEQAALRHLLEAAAASPLHQPATPLAEVLDHLCGALGRRVVLVCDEFDTALQALPAAALRELRALRDAHKYHLTFVLGLRAEPKQIAEARAGEPGVAKFAELVEAHTYPLRPYASADTRVTLARKALRWEPPLTPEEADALHRATGGHAKLLIAALTVLEPRRSLPWANVERALLADPALVETCRALWLSLWPAERWAVWQLAREHTHALSDADPSLHSGQALARLRLRGLAIGGPPSVFSSLFEAFAAGQPEPDASPLPASRLRDPASNPRW